MPVRREQQGNILLVTLDRPQAGNSIDGEMYQQLIECWRDFEADDGLAVAIVTGAGERAFCTGRDLVAAADAEADWTMSPEGPDPASRIVPECKKPVIAAINGHCLAGGLALALGCDLRLCTPSSTFGTMAVKRGIIAAAGAIQRLVRYIPFGKAMELILLGEKIDAEEAFRIGLVNRVVPAGELMAKAREWAQIIAQNSPLAVRMSKQAAYQGGLGQDFRDGRRLEAELYARIVRSDDAAEGLAAFAEKRPPRFPGR
jgi:enoyl-CoA hydratase/carnithine racemase